MQNFDLSEKEFAEFESAATLSLSADLRGDLNDSLMWRHWQLGFDASQPAADQVKPYLDEVAKAAGRLHKALANLVVADPLIRSHKSAANMAIRAAVHSLGFASKEFLGKPPEMSFPIEEWTAITAYLHEVAKLAVSYGQPVKGRSSNAPIHALISDLASIYEKACGKSVGVGMSYEPTQLTAFQRFVQVALHHLKDVAGSVQPSTVSSRIRTATDRRAKVKKRRARKHKNKRRMG